MPAPNTAACWRVPATAFNAVRCNQLRCGRRCHSRTRQALRAFARQALPVHAWTPLHALAAPFFPDHAMVRSEIPKTPAT